MAINELQFKTLFPTASMLLLVPLNRAMARYDITSNVRTCAFLAQVGEESLGLTKFVESVYYTDAARVAAIFKTAFRSESAAFITGYLRNSEKLANRAYANRNGNGPESSGDGYKYRGRGLIQITGKDNYRAAGTRMGMDLITHPELLEQPEPACYSAGDYWNFHGLNALADAGKFDSITQAINGAQTNADKRHARWETAKVVIGG